MLQKNTAARKFGIKAFYRNATALVLCSISTLLHTSSAVFADGSWGCLTQDVFWDRVQETITDSRKTQEITLSGRVHDSGYLDLNEYHQSLHIFDDGAWVVFNMSIRQSETHNEVLYCLISHGQSSTTHHF